MQLAPALCRVGNPVWTCLRASDGHTDRQTHTQLLSIVPASTLVCAMKRRRRRADRYTAPHRPVCPELHSCARLTSDRWDADRPPDACADRRHTSASTTGQRERERLNHQRFSFSIHKRLQYSVWHDTNTQILIKNIEHTNNELHVYYRVSRIIVESLVYNMYMVHHLFVCIINGVGHVIVIVTSHK